MALERREQSVHKGYSKESNKVLLGAQKLFRGQKGLADNKGLKQRESFLLLMEALFRRSIGMLF